MAMGERVQVTKGRISVPSKGIGREFMFNPAGIADDKGVNYGSLAVPGASHPVIQFGSGGARTISFDLYFDSDRGLVAEGTPRLDLKEDVSWYRALLYPGKTGGVDIQAVFPYLVLFSFGTMWDSVPCVVTKAALPPSEQIFTPKLEMTHCTLSMALEEVPGRTITAGEIHPDFA